MKTQAKRVVFYAILIGVATLVWAVLQNKPNSAKVTYSQFLQQVQAGEVNKAIVLADHTGANPVSYSLKDGSRLRSVLPSDYRDALDAMQSKMVNIEIRDASSQWLRVLGNWLPFFALLAFWVFMMNRMSTRRDAK